MRKTRRTAAAVAAILAVLAIAVPVTGASAATTPAAFPAFTGFTGFPAFHFPAFTPVPLSFVGPSVGFVGVAIGPTVINSVFNGGTLVIVSNGPAGGSVIGSP
jgi:hypothetical protein